jgi:hypothetical protein
MHRVHIDRPRPDFRVLIDLLYGAGSPVESDGDAMAVNSRAWTELYLNDRAADAPCIDSVAEPADPSLFRVASDNRALEELAALYLRHLPHCR